MYTVGESRHAWGGATLETDFGKEDSFWKLILSFHYGLWNWTQVTRLCAKCFYLLSCLDMPHNLSIAAASGLAIYSRSQMYEVLVICK